MGLRKTILSISILLLSVSCQSDESSPKTEITKWQFDKKSAVSLTYDDSTINQFRVALPLMNQRNMPGTFYIITGAIPGSEYKPKFVGRPVEKIIAETESVSTNRDNFFERASAVRFSGYEGTYQYHNDAASYYGRGELEKAYQVMDEAYRRIRNGEFPESNGYMDELYNVLAIEDHSVELITWEELKKYAEQGHEFGSHTILHPWLAVMDSVNIHYELEKSKEDIRNQLGPEHTFSAEAPFGTEDERVMEYAYDIFPALRNRMPHSFLTELNRASEEDPRTFDTEYTQWQRGALSDTPMETMKEWVDTSLDSDNIWLVLVFHGVEGVGWEPLSKGELEEYFNYIDEKREDLWIATFKDVTQYIRQRMNAEITTNRSGETITIELSHTLDKNLYDLPLTLKTYLSDDWGEVIVQQGDNRLKAEINSDNAGTYVTYQAVPNSDPIIISKK